MKYFFYGYELRSTTLNDFPLALAWSKSALDAKFWVRQEPGRESFLAKHGEKPIAFFQVEHVGKGDQVRLHWQQSPDAGSKELLRALIKLVPLIEKALALRGVRAIFFTSHSPAMAEFTRKRLGYDHAGDGGFDGVIMAKGIR